MTAQETAIRPIVRLDFIEFERRFQAGCQVREDRAYLGVRSSFGTAGRWILRGVETLAESGERGRSFSTYRGVALRTRGIGQPGLIARNVVRSCDPVRTELRVGDAAQFASDRVGVTTFSAC
jgi:hypothetical protein